MVSSLGVIFAVSAAVMAVLPSVHIAVLRRFGI
jgi:hypothetical protein